MEKAMSKQELEWEGRDMVGSLSRENIYEKGSILEDAWNIDNTILNEYIDSRGSQTQELMLVKMMQAD